MPTIVKLSRPLKTATLDISEITLRDISARDLVLMRRPIYSAVQLPNGGGVRMDQDYELAMKYLSALSGVDEITLGGMSAKDFDNACNVISEMQNGTDVKN